MKVYSLNVILHTLFLQKNAFPDEDPEIDQPAFVIKFVDFPPIQINGKKKLLPKHFELDVEAIEAQERMRIIAEIYDDKLNSLNHNRNLTHQQRKMQRERLTNQKIIEINEVESKMEQYKQKRRAKNAPHLLKKLNPKYFEQLQQKNENQQAGNQNQDQPLKVFKRKGSDNYYGEETEENEEEEGEKDVQDEEDQIDLTFGFGRGKVVAFQVEEQEMKQYLKEFALVVELKDDYDDRIIGYTLSKMMQFGNDVNLVNEKCEAEWYRRNTFTLYDRKDREKIVGWYDMSVSIQQRSKLFVNQYQVKKEVPHFLMQNVLQNRILKTQDDQQQPQSQELQVNDFMNEEVNQSKENESLNLGGEGGVNSKFPSSQSTNKFSQSQQQGLNENQELNQNEQQIGKLQQKQMQQQQQSGTRKTEKSMNENTSMSEYIEDFESVSQMQPSESHRISHFETSIKKNQHKESIDESYPDDFEFSKENFGTPSNQNNNNSNNNNNQFFSPGAARQMQSNFYKMNQQQQLQSKQSQFQQSKEIQESLEEEQYSNDFEGESQISAQRKQSTSYRANQTSGGIQNKKSEEYSENYSEDFEDISHSQINQSQSRQQIRPTQTSMIRKQEQSIVSDIYSEDFEQSQLSSSQRDNTYPSFQKQQQQQQSQWQRQTDTVQSNAPKRLSGSLVRKN